MRPLKDTDIIRAFNACQDDYTIEDMGNGQYAFMDNYSGTPFKIGDMGSILGYARYTNPRAFDKRMGAMIKEFQQEEEE